jgi:hypothetical protein
MVNVNDVKHKRGLFLSLGRPLMYDDDMMMMDDVLVVVVSHFLSIFFVS